MITTKRGERGDAKVTFDAKWGAVSRATKNYDVVTSPGQYYEMLYQTYYNGYYYNNGWIASRAYAEANSSIASATGYTIYTVPDGEYLVGTNGKLNPNATLGYSDGLIKGSGFERLTGRLNVEYKAKKWLTIGANMAYTKTKSYYPGSQTSTSSSANAFFLANTIAPIYPMYVRNLDGSIAYDSGTGKKIYDYGDGSSTNFTRNYMSIANPIGDLTYDVSTYDMNIFEGNWFAKIDFGYGFSATARLALHNDNTIYEGYSNNLYGQSAAYGGIAEQEEMRETALTHQYLLNYINSFGKHNVSLTAGFEGYRLKYEYFYGYGYDLYKSGDYALGNATSSYGIGGEIHEYNTAGFFFSGNYNWDETYYLNVGYRRDGTSAFAKDNRWGNFFNFGLGWNMKANVLENAEALDLFKVRVSFGQTGNDNYSGYYGWYSYEDIYYMTGSDGSFADGTLLYKGNSDLEWEKTNSFDIGIDASLWRNRLSDINRAITLLEESGYNRTDKRYVDVFTAYAIRAEVELVMQDYSAALEDANYVIENSGASPYTRDEVSEPTFIDINDDAWLWGIYTSETDDVTTSGIVNFASHMGSFNYGYASVGAWRRINIALYDEIPSTDIRKGWFLDGNCESANLSDEYQQYVYDYDLPAYCQVKFAPYGGELYTSTNATDIPLIRIEEMYMIKAECEAMTGSPATGAATLQSFISTYRDPSYTFTSSSASTVVDEVFWHRRVEFYGEGVSWYDYLRLNKDFDRRGGGFEATELTMTLYRHTTSSALSVSLDVTENTDDVFEVPSTVAFASGESETSFTISFPSSDVGVTYTLSLEVPEEYVGIYMDGYWQTSLSTERVKWNSLGNATYTDDFMTTFYSFGNQTYEVEIQEKDSAPGLYRLVNPYGAAYPWNETYDDGTADWDTSQDWYFYVDAQDPDGVYIELQETGMDWGYGNIIMGSLAYYYMSVYGYTLDEMKSYGYTGTLVDGVITFPSNTLLICMPDYSSSYYYANTNGAFMVVLPGYSAPSDDDDTDDGDDEYDEEEDISTWTALYTGDYEYFTITGDASTSSTSEATVLSSLDKYVTAGDPKLDKSLLKFAPVAECFVPAV